MVRNIMKEPDGISELRDLDFVKSYFKSSQPAEVWIKMQWLATHT